LSHRVVRGSLMVSRLNRRL